MDVWTTDDALRGLCQLEAVGEERPTERVPDPVEILPDRSDPPDLLDLSAMTDSEIAQTASRLLREAALDAFHRAGAADWLHALATRKPEQFLKFLQRLLPQSIEASVTVQPFEVPKHIRDLSADDLKAMRVAHDILEGQFVEVKDPK